MEIYIDNKNLKTYFGITCLDYSGALSFAAERENEREWEDKSGVDKNLANVRYEAKEFVLSCIVKAATEGAAYNVVKTLVDYMFSKGCFILSLRDTPRAIRECYLCQRSNTIVGDINLRAQNSLYVFKLGLKDVNPNAVKYKTDVFAGGVTINYTKGQTAVIYWGNGDIGEVSNSGNYSHNNYVPIVYGAMDVIIDVDDNAAAVAALTADFSADVLSGYRDLEVQFTDASTGGVSIWAWDFGDNGTSSEQSPIHTYTTSGIFTVILQVFNAAQGSAVATKVAYITVLDNKLLHTANEASPILYGATEDDYLIIK